VHGERTLDSEHLENICILRCELKPPNGNEKLDLGWEKRATLTCKPYLLISATWL